MFFFFLFLSAHYTGFPAGGGGGDWSRRRITSRRRHSSDYQAGTSHNLTMVRSHENLEVQGPRWPPGDGTGSGASPVQGPRRVREVRGPGLAPPAGAAGSTRSPTTPEPRYVGGGHTHTHWGGGHLHLLGSWGDKVTAAHRGHHDTERGAGARVLATRAGARREPVGVPRSGRARGRRA